MMITRHLLLTVTLSLLTAQLWATPAATVLTVDPIRQKQTFDGMGCGTIFYSGHITGFSKRKKHNLQEEFYDVLFKDVDTHFLHLMIRPDFEPKNDNADPYLPAFDASAFKANLSALDVCKAAKKRRPGIKLFATLYTPPPWMKTNGKETGGGQERATLKPGLELEFGEYIWAYLQHMQRNGQPVHYLSICNEPDWAHSQPSYSLNPESHAALFLTLAQYFETMAKKFPEVPNPQLVAPNMLSAVSTAKKFWPAMQKNASDRYVDVVGAHDYDRRGHRWKDLRDLAGDRPVWCTEWCWNGKDTSPNLINSASEFWLAMTEAFNDGANVWMAYDWAYPPRQGGEALTHVDWGTSYHKTQIYHGFRQWCNALEPGMRVVDIALSGPHATGISTPGIKASAFVGGSPRRLVVHAANVQGQPSRIDLSITDPAYKNASIKIVRTNATQTLATMTQQPVTPGALTATLKPRELITFTLTP